MRMERLLDSYERFPNPIPEILAAARVEETVRTDLLLISCRFQAGPIGMAYQILSDAAHAMTPNLGQGGAQAVEDAYVLAGVIPAGKLIS